MKRDKVLQEFCEDSDCGVLLIPTDKEDLKKLANRECQNCRYRQMYDWLKENSHL